LKAFCGAAGAGIGAAELFHELLIAVNDSRAALHMGFGVEALTALGRALESRRRYLKFSA
jgi:hypothetical protein